MRVEFSKEFEKSVRKLSGKMLESVREAVQEVIISVSSWLYTLYLRKEIMLPLRKFLPIKFLVLKESQPFLYDGGNTIGRFYFLAI